VVSRAPWRRLTVLLALGVSGCAAVGPNYKLPAAATINAPSAQGRFVAAQNPAFTDQDPPAGWWRLYRDPTLDGLIARALAANTDLRVADANLERSQSLLTEARAARQPDVAVNFSTNDTERSAEAYVHAGPIPIRQLYDTGIAVSYDLDLFGRLRRGIEAASAQSEAVAAARDLARVNVVAETVRAYAEVCDAGSELATTRRLLSLQQQAAALVQRMARNGRDIDISVTRQQEQVDQLRAGVPSLEARQTNALYRLATLTGRPPAEYDAALARCQTPLRLSAPLPVGDGASLLKRRPDVRAAERRLAASTAEIGVDTAALYPSVQLGASLGSTGAVQDFASPLTDRYSFGPAISWRLNQSVPRAKIAEARAEVKADLARFDGAVLTALGETERALNVYTHDLERERSLQAQRDHADKVAEATRRLQSQGRVGALAALDAERSVVAAEQSLAVIQSQISQDQVSVFLALGGGWS
jgi:NodT family efflux transporter outer membrane factor (OMF) lipoprotein